LNILYYVRHGESESNLQGLIATRRLNEPLTERGRLQAEQTGTRFLGRAIDAIFSSSLWRAVETAQIIGAKLGLQPVAMDEFCEFDMGVLEGQPLGPDTRDAFRRLTAAWDEGIHSTGFEGGEDYNSVWRRMRSGIAQVLAGRENSQVMIVGHGGLFSTTIGSLAPSADVKQLRQREYLNCSVSELEMELRDGEWVATVKNWADFSHLSGEAGSLVIQNIRGE